MPRSKSRDMRPLLKKCNKCGLQLKRKASCPRCKRTRRKLAAEMIQEAKVLCAECGEDRPWCLDLHHINPDNKRFSLSHNGGRYSLQAIAREISKCIVLCANCHRDLHYKKSYANAGKTARDRRGS